MSLIGDESGRFSFGAQKITSVFKVFKIVQQVLIITDIQDNGRLPAFFVSDEAAFERCFHEGGGFGHAVAALESRGADRDLRQRRMRLRRRTGPLPTVELKGISTRGACLPDRQGCAYGAEPFPRLRGADRDRTGDLLNAIQALSQLSYSP